MDALQLKTHHDSSFVSETKKLSYPYIYIPRFGEEIALMVTCLKPGEIPLVLSDNGVLKQVSTCAVSALELSKLLRVYQFEMVLSETERRKIKTISDVMEVLQWMVSPSSS